MPTILVVDDNEMNRDLLSRRLERKGYEVALAEDGPQALAWLGDNPCDLVLLDIMMPGMSGVEVLQELRRERDGSELPIIMATAKDSSEDIVGALNAGANDYVTKPIDFPVVLARVETQLAVKAGADRIRELASEVETRNRFIRKVFGRYLTDEIVETLLDDPEGLALGGARREITILMADLRGFTSFASNHDPEQVLAVVNNFLSPMTEVIMRHGGTIDEFIGDAILVLFNALGDQDDHARRAVACAMEMQAAMAGVNAKNLEQGLPEVATGIGINSGPVIVGNIGSARRAKFGVVGHNVNMTARIESVTQGGQVLISDRTRELCGDGLELRGSQSVRPKGFDHDIELHEVDSLA